MKCPQCGSSAIATQRHIGAPIWCRDCNYVIKEERNDKTTNKITQKDVVEYLQKYQNWRRGVHDMTMDEAGLDSIKIGIMIDKAIEFLE